MPRRGAHEPPPAPPPPPPPLPRHANACPALALARGTAAPPLLLLLLCCVLAAPRAVGAQSVLTNPPPGLLAWYNASTFNAATNVWVNGVTGASGTSPAFSGPNVQVVTDSAGGSCAATYLTGTIANYITFV
jgi:hypothetical protein